MEETSTSAATTLQFRQDKEAHLRRHIREALDVALAEELAAALGSDRHQRTEQRQGYRHGRRERLMTTPDWPRPVMVPRGQIIGSDGTTHEFTTADCSLVTRAGHGSSTRLSWAVI